jgi:hypothetical protein
MSAHYFGNELEKTKRFQLGELPCPVSSFGEFPAQRD